jgi:hypothetical protein
MLFFELNGRQKYDERTKFYVCKHCETLWQVSTGPKSLAVEKDDFYKGNTVGCAKGKAQSCRND